MIIQGAEARLRWRWEPLFRSDEFVCHHCGQLLVETDLLDKLLDLRQVYDRPMVITSGYRCPEHNQRVSTTGEHGPHTTGAAADVAAFGVDAYDLVRLALLHGFSGVGVNQRGATGARYVHLDVLSNGLRAPRPRIWSYAG